MDVCLLSTPLQPTSYNDIQNEYVDAFYKIRLSNFKKIKALDFTKLPDIVIQDIPLLTLAGFLKRTSNHGILYFDLSTVPLTEIPPVKVYAFGSFSCNYHIALETARSLKQKYPQSRFIIGGPHATYMDGSILKDDVFDIVVRGEGESIFKNILDHLNGKKDISDIRGITCMKDGKIVRNPDDELKLRSVPIPDYSFLKNGSQLPTAIIFTSRGCPYKCSFCVNANMKNRVVYKRDQDIMDELERLYSTFGSRLFYVGDETFTLNEERALRIMNIFESFKEDAYWIFQTRIDRLTKKILAKLKTCKKLIEIDVGIENIDDSVLKLNQKNLTFSQICTGLQKLKKTGKKVLGYWIVGLPGETQETLKKNLHFMKYFLANGFLYLIEVGCFVPYPGTDIYRNPERYGITIHSRNFSGYTGESFPSYSTAGLSAERIFAWYLRVLQEIAGIYRMTYQREAPEVQVQTEKFDKGLF